MSIAFFISPDGLLIRVPQNHIGTVINDPGRFGLTMNDIQTVYERHGEPMGIEGEARKEILLKIIKDGWIRIRRYRNYWSVTVENLTPASQGLLQDWAEKMHTGIDGFKEPDKHTPVRISTTEGDFHCTIKEIAGPVPGRDDYTLYSVSQNAL